MTGSELRRLRRDHDLMTPLEYVRFVEKCRTTRLTATATPMLDQMPVKRTEAKLHVWRYIEPRQP